MNNDDQVCLFNRFVNQTTLVMVLVHCCNTTAIRTATSSRTQRRIRGGGVLLAWIVPPVAFVFGFGVCLCWCLSCLHCLPACLPACVFACLLACRGKVREQILRRLCVLSFSALFACGRASWFVSLFGSLLVLLRVP